jgi:hypothetical protein
VIDSSGLCDLDLVKTTTNNNHVKTTRARKKETLEHEG